MSKDVALIVALPPDLKAWVDAKAADIGLEAVTWLRMQVFAMRKAENEPQPQRWQQPIDNGTPETELEIEGPPADLDAIVQAKLAEAEEAGLTAPRHDPDAPPPLDETNVRPLRRAPMPHTTMPAHMNGLLG